MLLKKLWVQKFVEFVIHAVEEAGSGLAVCGMKKALIDLIFGFVGLVAKWTSVVKL
jgi:hypothetical protein